MLFVINLSFEGFSVVFVKSLMPKLHLENKLQDNITIIYFILLR